MRVEKCQAMTKAEVIAGPSCLTRAGDDEPVFVIRAKDPCAASAIFAWAAAAESRGVHEPEKIARARAEAYEFIEWRNQRFPKEHT